MEAWYQAATLIIREHSTSNNARRAGTNVSPCSASASSHTELSALNHPLPRLGDEPLQLLLERRFHFCLSRNRDIVAKITTKEAWSIQITFQAGLISAG